MIKTCVKCKLPKKFEEFKPHSRRKDGRSHICIQCVRNRKLKWDRDNHKAKRSYKKHKESIRNNFFKRTYGITVAQYNDMLLKQNSLCKICNRTCPSGKLLAVDHCHVTGKVRGLLCAKCNMGLGYFEDNPNFLEIAVDYLKQH